MIINKLKVLHKRSKIAYQYLERHENTRQLVVYLFVGGTAAIMDLVILYTLVSILHMGYIAGATTAFFIVLVYSFVSHKKFTFRHKGKNNSLRFILYFLSAIAGILLTLLLLSFLVEICKVWYFYAAVIIKFIILIYNFIVNKFVIFRILKDKEELGKYA
jgi:putative flippase GtrA